MTYWFLVIYIYNLWSVILSSYVLRAAMALTPWSTPPESTIWTSECHLSLRNAVGWWQKEARYFHTEVVSLLEGTMADIDDSYKYLGIPPTNGNLEQETRKPGTAKYLLPSTFKPGQRQEQNPDNRLLHTASYQIPCKNDKMAKGRETDHGC